MTAKRIVMIFVLLLASLIIILLALRAAWQHQTAARIKISSSGGVDSLEKVSIGGVDQWIQIHGFSGQRREIDQMKAKLNELR